MRQSQSLPASILDKGKWVKILFPTFFIILGWVFLWLFPWQDRVQGHVWLRLGIVLIVFIVPGSSIYGLLSQRDSFSINHITYGFVISHFLVAFIGLLGRFFHFSFELLINIFMASGGILLLLCVLPMFSRGFSFRITTITAEQWVIAISLT